MLIQPLDPVLVALSQSPQIGAAALSSWLHHARPCAQLPQSSQAWRLCHSHASHLFQNLRRWQCACKHPMCVINHHHLCKSWVGAAAQEWQALAELALELALMTRMCTQGARSP